MVPGHRYWRFLRMRGTAERTPHLHGACSPALAAPTAIWAGTVSGRGHVSDGHGLFPGRQRFEHVDARRERSDPPQRAALERLFGLAAVVRRQNVRVSVGR